MKLYDSPTVLGWSEYMVVDMSRWPVLAACLERVAACPKLREALVAEGVTG